MQNAINVLEVELKILTGNEYRSIPVVENLVDELSRAIAVLQKHLGDELYAKAKEESQLRLETLYGWAATNTLICEDECHDVRSSKPVPLIPEQVFGRLNRGGVPAAITPHLQPEHSSRPTKNSKAKAIA